MSREVNNTLMATKAEKFIGKVYGKQVVRSVMRLISLTCSNFRISKNHFKSEKSFWAVIEVITKLKPLPTEDFATSVFRIQGTFAQYSKAKRASMLASVKQKAVFDALGCVMEVSASVRNMPTGKTVLVTKAEKKQRIAKRREDAAPQQTHPSRIQKEEFYTSWGWRELRKKVLNEFGARCQCCGATPDHTDMVGKPVKIVVDHIKPLHHHWGLRLDRSNLQVLCDECNQGAGAWDETDHRPKPAPDEWIFEDEPSDLIADQLKIRH